MIVRILRPDGHIENIQPVSLEKPLADLETAFAVAIEMKESTLNIGVWVAENKNVFEIGINAVPCKDCRTILKQRKNA